MGILQSGKVILHNPTRDQISPQILIQGDKVLCLQVTPEESTTLMHMHLKLMEEGEEGGIIPHQEQSPDRATKQGWKRDSRRRDTELIITGVTDRGLHHPVK